MGKKLGLDKQYSSLLTSVNKNSPTNLMTNSTGNTFRSKAMNLAGSKVGKTAKFILGRTPIGKAVNLAINVGSGIGIGYSYAKNKFNKKKGDFQKGDYSDIKTDKKMGGGMMQGYGAARTSGMGLEDQSLMPGKMVRANTGKMLSAKQKKIARMAPPPDKITGADFKAMKAKNGKMVKMNKGGGMDMGAKKPLSFKEQLEKARAEGKVEKTPTSKYLKKKSRGDKINALLKAANVPNMNKGGGMDMGNTSARTTAYAKAMAKKDDDRLTRSDLAAAKLAIKNKFKKK